MINVKFTSNNDDIRDSLPFGAVGLNVLPQIGHKVKLSKYSTVAKVTDITHVIGCPYDVEIYLSPIY